jgi:hypothetical protein
MTSKDTLYKTLINLLASDNKKIHYYQELLATSCKNLLIEQYCLHFMSLLSMKFNNLLTDLKNRVHPSVLILMVLLCVPLLAIGVEISTPFDFKSFKI